MKTFIGSGIGGASTAVENATSGLYLPSLIIFYAPYDKLAEAASELKRKYPQSQSIGVIGTKVINGTSNDNGIVVVGFFDDVRVQAGVIKNVSKCPAVAIPGILNQIAFLKSGEEDSVCIEYCTNNEENVVTILNSCINGTGIKLVGATAFGTAEGEKPLVAFNGEVYEDACVYAFVKNNTGRVKVFKENIYKKGKDSKPHCATSVDTAARVLKTLDDKAAADVYSTEIGIPKGKIVDNVFKNPIGRVVDDEVFITSIKDVYPGGAFENFKRINRNDCIYFLELGDYRSIEEETRTLINESVQHISLILSVDCIYRYLFYQQEDYFDTYIKDMASLGKHVGIIGGGEQFNNQHVNQTMVCVVFE